MSSTHLKISFVYISLIIFIFYLCGNISAFNSPHFKLPSAIFPTKYHLHIRTSIHRDILPYNGSVSIDLIAKNSSNEIVLNSEELSIFDITLMNLDNGLLLEKSQLNYELDGRKQQLRIYWPSLPFKMKSGQQYRLKIDFTGNIQDHGMHGFYKSTYLDGSNSVSLAMTHFEPTSARLAFPCFDEPAYKAKFVISITHGKNYSAISNMPADGDPVLSSPANEEMVTTKFLETPLMSTYLVTFVVSNYDKTTDRANGFVHRFFYPPNHQNQGNRALGIARKAVNTFSNLLGIQYSLPKLDQFATNKLQCGSMENLGLIALHHDFIVPDDYNMPNLIKVMILNHEIAHQWFGSLVTPVSWDYVWMTEGFSTYFSYFVTNMLYPDKKIFDYFLMNDVPQILSTPLNRPLTSIIEEGAPSIMENYNANTYFLGASVVRMFHHAIGHSTFMKGIFKYLSIFQYSAVDEDDFFMAMQAAVNEDNVSLFQNNQSVANVMKTWTHNEGIPIVKITRNNENGTITIRQKPASGKKDQKWWIPMSFVTETNPNFDGTIADYIMPPQAEVTLDLKDLNINLSNNDWIIVNKQQTGIFYVVYDDVNLKQIIKALKSDNNKIHVYNRALIFRDISLTINEEFYNVEQLKELLDYLYFENEYMPWFNAADLILKLLAILEGCENSEKFKLFINKITFLKFGFQYENFFESEKLTNLNLEAKIKSIRFKVDTILCQNYTTESAKEYFINGVVEKHKMPCKVNLCQAIQNAKHQELKPYLNRIAREYSEAYEFFEFDNLLDCVVSEEIFENILSIFQNNPNSEVRYHIFAHAFRSNEFFKTWGLKYHKAEIEKFYAPEERKREVLLEQHKKYCTISPCLTKICKSLFR